jgi:hypothetical protein
MKTNASKFIIWIIVITILLTTTLVLLLVPMFTVDLDLNKCSNINWVQMNEQLNSVGMDDITEVECVVNGLLLSVALTSYMTINNFDISTLTEDKIPEGDVITVSNLGIGDKFHTVTFNVRKLFRIDDDDLTILKLKKNLIGTIYRF